jgi:lysozyme
MNFQVEGADVSTWQALIDWIKLSSKVDFAFIRAGSINNETGNCYVDYQFVRNAQLAPPLLPVGFYWYFRPNHDPVRQAEYFADLIRTVEWKLPPVADVEFSNQMAQSIVADRVHTFVARLSQLLDVKPIIYTRGAFWNIAVGNPTWASSFDCWIARYRSNDLDTPDLTGPWADGRFKPRSWDTWRFWQWQADGNNKGEEYGVQSDDIDLNVFNGTMDEFNRYLGIDVPPPPPIDDDLVAWMQIQEEKIDLLRVDLTNLETWATNISYGE